MSIFKDSLAASTPVPTDWRELYPAWAAVGLIPLQRPGDGNTGKEPIHNNWTAIIEARLKAKEGKDETFSDVLHELERGRNLGLVIPPGTICLDYDDPATADSVLQLYPDAPAQVTQKGGVHLWFRIKPGEEFKGTVKLAIDGLIFDIRAAGRNQVAVFPSTGLLGKYRWLRPLPADISSLPLRPEGCTQALATGQKASPAAMVDVSFGAMPDTSRGGIAAPTKEEIKQIRNINPHLADKIKNPSPIGAIKGRNNALLSAVGTCFAALYDFNNPPSALGPFRMLRACVLSYDNPDPSNPPPSLVELWSMTCRVGRDELNKWFELQGIMQAVNYWKIQRLKQTEQVEKEAIAEATKDLGITPEQLKKQALLFMADGRHYYVFNEKLGGYSGPVAANGLLQRITEGCPNLFNPADIYTTSPQGIVNMRLPHFLLRDFGKPVTRVDRVAGQGLPTYDAGTETMTAGVWALRDLEPRRDPYIEGWLNLLGGEDKEQLLDWLATITRTDRPNSCLYIKGPKAIGKSLLVDGLARLWGRKATRYRDVMARFNDSFVRSPLVHLDEGLSDKTDSLRFREFISENEHVIETKGQPQYTLRGCARCVVTSNNVNALKIYESLNTDDIEAISCRVTWVSTKEKAAVFLRQVQGRSTTTSWVEEDLIARHVLWLAETRVIKENSENRFLVPGVYHPEKLQMLREFRSNGSVFEVLAQYLIDCASMPKGQHYRQYSGIMFSEGTMAVNRKGLVEYWEGKEKEYGQMPSPRDAKASLRIMSLDVEKSKRTLHGPRKFHIIDYDLLMDEVERLIPDSALKVVEHFLFVSPDDR